MLAVPGRLWETALPRCGQIDGLPASAGAARGNSTLSLGFYFHQE